MSEKKADSKEPAVVRTIKRAGLTPFVEVRADLNTAEGQAEVVQFLQSNNFPARLTRARARAKAYPSIESLHDDIAWADELQHKEPLAVSWALTAIERGLSLLDNGVYLDTLVSEQGRKKRQRLATIESNKARAKQPSAEDLQAELATKVAKGTPLEIAKPWLARKYKVTPQAQGQRLKKTKGP